MLTSILVFILAIGLLIFVHELGHFLAARRNGVLVEEFCLGFPPRIFKKKVGETLYSIGLLPIGGFVKIHGEDGEEKNDSRSFASKSVWQRTKIISAGVLMNVLLGVVLLFLGYLIGVPALVGEETSGIEQVQILEVFPDSAAQKAGLRTGDILIEAEAAGTEPRQILKTSDLIEFTGAHRGQPIFLEIERGGEILKEEIVLSDLETSPLGVAVGNVGKISYPWYRAFWEAVVTTFSLIVLICVNLFKLIFTGGVELSQVSGPVGIYNLTDQATRMGFVYVLQFTVILSLHLAVINILPFPALDGGRLFFLAIEKIKRSPVSRQVEQKAHLIGFFVLIALMILITVKDVLGLF